jgi:hypothetical protein
MSNRIVKRGLLTKALALSSVVVLGGLFALAPASAAPPMPSSGDQAGADLVAEPPPPPPRRNYKVMAEKARAYKGHLAKHERRIGKIKNMQARRAATRFHSSAKAFASVSPDNEREVAMVACDVQSSVGELKNLAQSDTADFDPQCLDQCLDLHVKCKALGEDEEFCDFLIGICIEGCVPSSGDE